MFERFHFGECCETEFINTPQLQPCLRQLLRALAIHSDDPIFLLKRLSTLIKAVFLPAESKFEFIVFTETTSENFLFVV